MLKELVKLADVLDQKGCKGAANEVDGIIAEATRKTRSSGRVKKTLDKRVKGGDEAKFIYHVVEDLKKAKDRQELRIMLKQKSDELRQEALREQEKRDELSRLFREQERAEWEELTQPEEDDLPAPPKLL